MDWNKAMDEQTAKLAKALGVLQEFFSLKSSGERPEEADEEEESLSFLGVAELSVRIARGRLGAYEKYSLDQTCDPGVLSSLLPDPEPPSQLMTRVSGRQPGKSYSQAAANKASSYLASKAGEESFLRQILPPEVVKNKSVKKNDEIIGRVTRVMGNTVEIVLDDGMFIETSEVSEGLSMGARVTADDEGKLVPFNSCSGGSIELSGSNRDGDSWPLHPECKEGTKDAGT